MRPPALLSESSGPTCSTKLARNRVKSIGHFNQYIKGLNARLQRKLDFSGQNEVSSVGEPRRAFIILIQIQTTLTMRFSVSSQARSSIRPTIGSLTLALPRHAASKNRHVRSGRRFMSSDRDSCPLCSKLKISLSLCLSLISQAFIRMQFGRIVSSMHTIHPF